MKKIRFLALLTALALLLAGCGQIRQEQTITGVYTDVSGAADLPGTPSSSASGEGQTPADPQITDGVQAPDGSPVTDDAGAEDEPQASDESQTTDGAQTPDGAEVWAPEYGGYYYDVKNVVLYLEAYGELPPNYITKNEARDLGWSGGSVEDYLEGAAIGGDRFGNYEGLLPETEGRTWTECDIDTLGYGSRGSRRLVFSNDGLYYYTSNHYESFKEVTVENGEVSW